LIWLFWIKFSLSINEYEPPKSDSPISVGAILL
jgi:hypothetical protein